MINNIKYTRVNDGTDIYYRVDGVHRDVDTSNAIENLTLEDSIPIYLILLYAKA